MNYVGKKLDRIKKEIRNSC